METNGTTQEPFMRLNFSQNTKGMYFAEWTIRGNTIEEIKARNEELRNLALEELKKLNGDGKNEQ